MAWSQKLKHAAVAGIPSDSHTQSLLILANNQVCITTSPIATPIF